MLAVVSKRMQQLATGPGPSVHHGKDTTKETMHNEHAWPQQCWKSCETDPILLRFASAITEQKKCWELLAEKFDRFKTFRNGMQQGVQMNATCNIKKCWEVFANNVVPVCT